MMGTKEKDMERQAYIDKMEAQMKEWEAEIQKLKAKAEKADAQARIDYNKEIRQLAERRDELNQKLQEVKASGSNAWEDLKSGVEKARDELDSALKSAASHFK